MRRMAQVSLHDTSCCSSVGDFLKVQGWLRRAQKLFPSFVAALKADGAEFKEKEEALVDVSVHPPRADPAKPYLPSRYTWPIARVPGVEVYYNHSSSSCNTANTMRTRELGKHVLVLFIYDYATVCGRAVSQGN